MIERNLNKFINTATSIWGESAELTNSIGYASKFLIQTTFPHSDPGKIESIVKINGREAVSIRSGFVLDQNGNKEIVGLPFGSLPRLILVWLSSEAVKTQSREIHLGKNMKDFMLKIGMDFFTGGKNGTITRTKEQMLRLFLSSFYVYKDKKTNQITEQFASNFQIAKNSNLWWDNDTDSLTQGMVLLDEDFFTKATETIVPIDIRVIKLLKKSPMALDLYCWLTYRFSYLNKETSIPWKGLINQFGTGYNNSSEGVRGFRRKVEQALRKINTVWEINIECDNTYLTLKPTSPHIKKRNLVLLPK